MMMSLLDNFILLFVESAPYLLVGLFLAGVIRVLIPDQWIHATLGKNSSVWTAALIGAPLPLCSCSVIPAAMGIRRAGASKASTASFMVATPETGVDSIGVTYALMGPVMAITRPVSAIFSAVVTGLMVRWVAVESPSQESPVTGCCKKKAAQNNENKFVSVVRYGFGQLLSDFMGWLLIGLFFAALIQTFVPTQLLTDYGDGLLAMLAVVLISIPMYICATASTPVAAALMLSGISPGAALVFMLAGPATNIATLAVVKRELGMSALVAYLFAVIGCALGFGYLLNQMIGIFDIQVLVSLGDHHDMINGLYMACGVVLALLIGYQYYLKLSQRPDEARS